MTYGQRLMALVATLAAVGLLAGCGGGGGGAPTVTITTNGDDTSTALRRANALKDVTEVLDDVAAATGADSALATARKADGKLRDAGAAAYDASLQGSSMKASAYAQMVLAAQADLQRHRKAVQDALAKAKAALEAASADEKENLNDRIERAEAAIKAADAVLDATGPNSLDALVKAYMNTADGDENTPAERAAAYAAAIKTMLEALTTVNTGTAPGNAGSDVRFGDDTSRDTATMVKLNDVSMMGLTAPSAFGTDATTDHPEGTNLPSGLPGLNAYCDNSDGCKGVDAGGTFGEGWVFRAVNPTGAQAYYTRNDNGWYTQAQFVGWGLWLDSAGDLQRFVGAGSGSAPLGTGVITTRPASATADTRATYRGQAAGLAARTTGTGEAARTASGHFTADVTLNAVFGQSDGELSGTIGTFRPVAGQGTAHVNRNWALELTRVLDWSGQVTDGRFNSGGTGAWTATPYGKAAANPEGIFGGFNAEFQDGAAAGVYHTTAQ